MSIKTCKIESQYSTTSNLVCHMTCGDYVVTSFTDTIPKMEAHKKTCKILHPNLPQQTKKFWRLNITKLGQWGGYHTIPFGTKAEAIEKQQKVIAKAKALEYQVKTEIEEYERGVYD